MIFKFKRNNIILFKINYIMSVLKQIYINKIKLPTEIKDIIKDFLFNNLIEIMKKIKNKICLKLSKSKFTGRTLNSDPEKFSFYIAKESKLYSFKICKNCGEYLTSKIYVNIKPRIKCKCD